LQIELSRLSIVETGVEVGQAESSAPLKRKERIVFFIKLGFSVWVIK
jgi:hypothetical protein